VRVTAALIIGLILLAAAAKGGARDSAARAPNSVAFWTDQIGLIGLDSCLRRCSRGAVALTIDGGRTSRVVFSTDRDVAVAGARGRSTAWIITRSCRSDVCRNERLFVTRDRGRHWRLLARRPPTGVDFANARLGMAVAGGNPYANGPTGIVLTSDGGRSWHHVHSPCRSWSGGATVSFPRPDRAWALCTSVGGVGSEEKAVYESRDRGHSWRAQAETLVFGRRRVHGGIDFYGYPLGISFATDGTGLLWEGRGTLYSTRDGGRQWRPHPRLAQPDADFGIAAWSLRNGRGFVLLERLPSIKLLASAGGRWRIRRRWILGP
jgi:photosystem II stability/assembly factor-like uncharacterized protein